MGGCSQANQHIFSQFSNIVDTKFQDILTLHATINLEHSFSATCDHPDLTANYRFLLASHIRIRESGSGFGYEDVRCLLRLGLASSTGVFVDKDPINIALCEHAAPTAAPTNRRSGGQIDQEVMGRVHCSVTTVSLCNISNLLHFKPHSINGCSC